MKKKCKVLKTFFNVKISFLALDLFLRVKISFFDVKINI